MSSNDVTRQQLPTGAGSATDVDVRPAASVIVVRGEPLEILLIRRTEKSSFVPGSWLFPGGTVDAVDRDVAREMGAKEELDVARVCAARELYEESGIWIGNAPAPDRDALRADASIFSSEARSLDGALDRLVWTSRWVTPVGVPKRFDTYFFLLEVSAAETATPDGVEATDVVWITPAEALERERAGTLPMVFPTIRNIMALRGSASAESLIASRRGVEVPTTRPVLVIEGDRRRIVLPEEA